MVNAEMSNVSGSDAEARDAERRLILSYATTAEARAGTAALLALDATLADVLRHVSEPMIAQMRLTWWHEAIAKLDTAPPPAQPVLQALSADVVAQGVAGSDIAAMVEGWEALLDGDPAEPDVRRNFAVGRGGRLFALAARLTGGADVDAAGRGWALADLARSLSDRKAAEAAIVEARTLLDQATARRWARSDRALGGLTHQAAMDVRVPLDQALPAATPKRIARLAWHRLTGR